MTGDRENFIQSVREGLLKFPLCRQGCILDNTRTFCVCCGRTTMEEELFSSLNHVSQVIVSCNARDRLEEYIEAMNYYDN